MLGKRLGIKRGIPLSARSVETVKEPGSYSDGRRCYGLSLFIERRKNGRLNKQWRQRGHIDGKQENYEALPYAAVGDALATIRASDAMPAVRLVLEFIALTAARPTEAWEAQWEEVDFESATWTIPAARMKGGAGHRVPLLRSRGCDFAGS